MTMASFWGGFGREGKREECRVQEAWTRAAQRKAKKKRREKKERAWRGGI